MSLPGFVRESLGGIANGKRSPKRIEEDVTQSASQLQGLFLKRGEGAWEQWEGERDYNVVTSVDYSSWESLGWVGRSFVQMFMFLILTFNLTE